MELDPVFVFSAEDPDTFWLNKAYFQSEAQRKLQEGLERNAAAAKAWLEAEQEFISSQSSE